MARKTVEIEFLKEKANYFLEHSDAERVDARAGMIALLEVMLFKTDTYKGFGYLPSELDNGTLVQGHDETRRRYF